MGKLIVVHIMAVDSVINVLRYKFGEIIFVGAYTWTG